MNKKFLVLPFLALIIAGCDIQDINNSSIINSFSIPSSIPTTSESTSSITSNSSTSSATSSSSSTVSSSTSTSIPDSTSSRTIPFDEIQTLVAQIIDAEALGVQNSKDQPQTSGRKASQNNNANQNYIVKVTETINPNTTVNEDKTINVNFTRLVTTVTNELQTGSEAYVAKAEPFEIEKTIDLPGYVVVKNAPNYEFRALTSDKAVIQDWKTSVTDTVEFKVSKLESGSFDLVALAPTIEITKVEEPGKITVTNVNNYEFRIVSGTNSLSEWTRSNDATIEFTYDPELTNVTVEARSYDASITFASIEGFTYDVFLVEEPLQNAIVSNVLDGSTADKNNEAQQISITGLTQGLTYRIEYEGQVVDTSFTNMIIEARSTDASISFTAFKDFTYTIKSGDTTLYANVTDNNIVDLNPKTGVITVKGLVEAQSYDVLYSGYQLVETITQEDIEGQVDKLYVSNEYTFISFVPLTLNQRPQDKDLTRDYDRVPLYDKQGYFSNNTRQSFVFDNDTGLIYKIDGIQIANLSGGCVRIQDNPFPFDMNVDASGALKFTSINTNPALMYNSCIKDKYGYKYINNNVLNTYESNTKTYYYVPNQLYSRFYDVPFNNQYGNLFMYWLTSSGEVVRTEPTTFTMGGLMYRVMTGEGVNAHRAINENDNFEIYLSQFKYTNLPTTLSSTFIQPLVPKNLVKNGTVYSFFGPNVTGKANPVAFSSGYGNYDQFNYVVKHENGNITYFAGYINPNYGKTNMFYATINEYLEAYGIFIVYRDKKVFYYTNYWQNFEQSFGTNNNAHIQNFSRSNPSGGMIYGKFTENILAQPTELTDLEGTLIDSNGKLNLITASQNTTFDLIAEQVNEQWVIKAYPTGTYTAPAPTTITFQPINR